MSGEARRSSRVGVLVLRVWRESPGPGGLRVHVRTVADVEQGDERVVVAASVTDAVDVVRTWLVQQAAGSAPPS